MIERLRSMTADGCIKFVSYNEAKHPVRDLALTSQGIETRVNRDNPDRELDCGLGTTSISRTLIKPMSGGSEDNGIYARIEIVQSAFGPDNKI